MDQAQPAAIVATSANFRGEPLIINDDEAQSSLKGIADLIVIHDRAIRQRADDSLMVVIDSVPRFLRRSRGAVPDPIDLGSDGPAVLAVGAHLKATVCVTRGREAFLSQHIGNLGNAPTIRCYEETAARMLAMLNVAPELVACDLHPDYRSTLFAEATGLPVLRVQHHAAHLAAVSAEHRLGGKVLGAALDGHGYGDDTLAWGGELIMLDGARWHRIGSLQPLTMPGGDRAAREPWRMGVSVLAALGRGGETSRRFPAVALAGPLAEMLARGGAAPLTSSLGRLFDAAAALLGLSLEQSYEGQAAMELEALVRVPKVLPGAYRIRNGVLDFMPLFAALLERQVHAAEAAELFHGTLIAGLVEWIGRAAAGQQRIDVLLAGGCLANRILAEGLVAGLRLRGLVPWLPQAAPANDGGIALGQAAIARAHLCSLSPSAAAERN
jgi:hydrogenase maturation protein HypF